MTTVQSGFDIAKPTALTGASYTTVGSMAAGTYGYAMTFVTNFGETDLGTPVSVIVPANGSVRLVISQVTPENVIKRNLYRTTVGTSTYLLLTSLSPKSETEYIDTVSDSSLGVAAPTSNTASSLQVVRGNVGFSGSIFRTITTLTARAGGGQANATPLVSEYNNVSVVATAADSVLLPLASASTVGKVVVVKNSGAAAAAVFPSVGQTINGGAVNASVSLANGSVATYVQATATGWVSF